MQLNIDAKMNVSAASPDVDHEESQILQSVQHSYQISEKEFTADNLRLGLYIQPGTLIWDMLVEKVFHLEARSFLKRVCI